MHDMIRGGLCGRPDGHTGPHRSDIGLANYRASQLRYDASPARVETRDRWEAENTVKRAMIWVTSNAKRRSA